VHFSRLASNNALVALCTVISMSALYRATRSGRAAAYVWAGTFLGLCFYFGNKAVMLPPMMLAGLAALALVERGAVLCQWRMWLLCLAVALCVGAPQFSYYAGHDWYGPLLSHPVTQSIAVAPEGAKPVSDIVRAARLARVQIERSLLAFQYYPDTLYLVTFKSPLLPVGEAAVFLVGLVYCLAHWRVPLSAFLLGWFVVGLQGSMLSRYPPQANHMIGMVSVPAAFAAIAIDLVRRRCAQAAGHRAAAGVGIALVSLLAAQGIHQYFVRDAERWAMVDITQVARAVRALAPTHDVVLVDIPVQWEQQAAFRFITYGVEGVDKLSTSEPGSLWHRPGKRPIAFIIGDPQPPVLQALRARYPHGVLDEHHSPAGQRVVAIYRVPRPEVPSR
jgi:hypothetical protein